MLAIAWGSRYLYPFMIVPVYMLQIAHFLAVMCDRVTYRSMFYRLGQSVAGSFM